MSGKQNNKDQNTQNREKPKEDETFTNPVFPNKIFKKNKWERCYCWL